MADAGFDVKNDGKKLEYLDTLGSILSDITSQHDISRLLPIIPERAARLLGASDSELGLIDRKRPDELVIMARFPFDKKNGTQTVASGDGILGSVAQSREPLILHVKEMGQIDKGTMPMELWSTVMAAPLVAHGRLQGVLMVADRDPVRKFTSEEMNMFLLYAKLAALAIRNTQLLDVARRRAGLDSLTGLYNHRCFFGIAGREVSRALRYRRPLSVIMFDIDFFKQINDSYGHTAGDEVLESVARMCKHIFRKVDIIGRYGGDEFAVLLPDTGIELARGAAERLRKAIARTLISVNGFQFSITISLGIASMNRRCLSLSDLIHRADTALYAAKDSGRDVVRVWSLHEKVGK